MEAKLQIVKSEKDGKYFVIGEGSSGTLIVVGGPFDTYQLAEKFMKALVEE